jgi:TonB family protein
MRRGWGILIFVVSAASYAVGQQTVPSAPSQSADDLPERVKIYAVGPGVTAPKLLSTSPIQIDAGECKKKVNSKVVFSMLVDSTGQPRNLMFLQPLGNEMDRFALQVASADRFTPGSHNGASVVIGQTLEVGLQGCIEVKKDDEGNKTVVFRLRFQPSQEFRPLVDSPVEAVLAPKDWSWGNSNGGVPPVRSFEGSVRAPVLLKGAAADLTSAAREAKLQGKCKISFVVDRNGMPQNVIITRSLDNGVDQNAVNSVKQYRFKPAMKDGEPVPALLNVDVDFRLY